MKLSYKHLFLELHSYAEIDSNYISYKARGDNYTRLISNEVV